MKSKKVLKISGIIVVLFAIFRLVNPDLTKSITILDCKSEYKMSVFGREYEGFRYHNAKMDVAKCLCKKYIQTKNKKYPDEIYKIINEFELNEFVEKKSIEEICKNSEEIFSNWYYE